MLPFKLAPVLKSGIVCLKGVTVTNARNYLHWSRTIIVGIFVILTLWNQFDQEILQHEGYPRLYTSMSLYASVLCLIIPSCTVPRYTELPLCRRVSEGSSFPCAWCTVPQVPYLTMPSCVEGEDGGERKAGSNIGASVEGVGAGEEERSICGVEEKGWQDQGSEVGG